MKLLNFQSASGGEPKFGVVITGYAVSFETLQQKSGQTRTQLTEYLFVSGKSAVKRRRCQRTS